MTTHAVFTGDLIASRSSGSTPVAAAMDTLAGASDAFCTDHGLPASRFTRFRSDGTSVQPHVRSSPDGQRWNNYGPSRSPVDRFNPGLRDYDNDGLSNQYDMDSDNDGYFDDFDSNPYGR